MDALCPPHTRRSASVAESDANKSALSPVVMTKALTCAGRKEVSTGLLIDSDTLSIASALDSKKLSLSFFQKNSLLMP